MTVSGSSSSSVSSSSSSDDSINDMNSSSLKPRQKILLNDDDSSDEDGDNDIVLKSDDTSGFNINSKYAREYEQRKRREELTKHRKVNFDVEDDDDSSSSESEDEEGELLTPHLDAQIAKTLKALRRKDDSVYDKNVTFYAKGNDSDEEEGESGDKKLKRKTYKDVVREQILEQMVENEGNTNAKSNSNNTAGSAGDLAYDEEQRDIRRAFLESTRKDGNDENENGCDDSDDDWIKPKTKSKTSSDDQGEAEEEARKLWEQELHDTAAASDAPNKSNLRDPHGEVQDGDQFLMEFMTHKKWLENGANKLNDDNDDDQSLEDLERMDEFESKYNFRFEEAAAAADSKHNMDTMTSGASHSIVHYARGSNAENVLRRKDESRRQKRLARKERKAEERKAKEEKLRRLKNARRDELDERMKQVRNVLGGEEGKPDAALGGAEEEMILKLMEGDYNPEKFEQVMNSVYGDDYYEKEDEAWKNDQDVKRDLANGTEESDVLGDGEMYDEENADENYDEEYGDEEYNDEAYDEGETQYEAPEEETKMNKKLKDKMMDELYKLDYEDIIGDMPTRFKYRTVEKNTFGLSTEEILFAKDSTLKQFVSLKKMASYNEEEYQPGTKKRKRFRQLLKADKEEMKEEDGVVEEKPIEPSEGDGETKKKKRRRQKKNKKSSIASDVATQVTGETNVVANEIQDESDEKQQTKKKEDSKDHPENKDDAVKTRKEDSVGEVDRKKSKKSKSKTKDGSKKYSEGAKKKKKRSKVEGVSGARLAAYGF